MALIAAALVIAALESTVALTVPATRVVSHGCFFRPATVPTVEDSILQWQLSRLTSLPASLDVILLGDSSCLMGLDARVLAANAGLTSWNLGTVGWLGTAGHAELLEFFLRCHAPPQTVVYQVTPQTLAFSQAELNRLGIQRQVGEWLHPERRWLPSRRLRFLLNRWWLDAAPGVRAEARGVFPSDAEVARLLLAQRGYLTDPQAGPLALRAVAGPSPAAGPGLNHLAALADHYGFALILMLAPLPESLHQPANEPALEHLVAVFQAQARAASRVQVLEPTVRFYPDELFAKVTHLTPTGTTRNTTELGAWLLARRNARRPAK